MSTASQMPGKGKNQLRQYRVSIDRLAAYKDVDVLCFDHDNSKDMDALTATPLWQAMPFVRAGRFQRVPAVWFLRNARQCNFSCAFWITPSGGKA